MADSSIEATQPIETLIVNQLAADSGLVSGAHALAALLYAALALWCWRSQPQQRLLHGFMVIPIVLQAVGLWAALWSPSVMHISFAVVLSLSLWLALLIYWFEAWRINVGGLSPFLLPVAVLAALAPAIYSETRPLAHTHSLGFQVHFLLAMLAYSLFTLAALYTVFMGVCEKALHRRQASRLLIGLPPLLSMEALLFRLLWVAFVFLSAALASGLLFSEEIFGRALRFEHKTLFGFVAWGIFATLLAGRHFYGWRGKRAQYLTLAGFLALLLAYVGTRFILEILLGRI